MVQGVQTWQQAILAHFTPKRERMLLVIDPDNLMRDDALLAEIQNRNYDVLELSDEVTFRAAFERTYRSRWDEGEALHVVVVVHTTRMGGMSTSLTSGGERHVPYDLWKKSRRIELSVSALFPHLNAIVVSQLDNAYYADLYPAHRQLVERGEMLRLERQTVEFILRVVFGLDPLGAGDPARWVEFLIHKHYSAREIPPALETYIAERLLPRVAGAGLRPEFLNHAEPFYAWLGEQWAAYVDLTGLSDLSGLDLGDLRLRPLLAHLFAEGLVARVPAPSAPLPAERAWTSIGLQPAAGSTTLRTLRDDERQRLVYALRGRLERFQAMDETTLPGGKTDVRDWLDLAVQWAEAIYQANSLPQADYEQVQPALVAARLALDVHFWDFVQARYSAVHYYQDNKGPISVAGVNRWLYEQVEPQERLALICFDGLALDQWFLLRDHLRQVLPSLAFHENRTYAMAPTVTSVSRQALFAGRPPTAFAETLMRTDQDVRHWEAYWINHDVPPKRVAYVSAKVTGQGFDEVDATTSGKNCRLGVLINLFDDVMHAVKGMTPEADKRVYYAALHAYLEDGCLERLFAMLLERNYRVFVAADHGNIAGRGNGVMPARALVETYARRVAIYDQDTLAREFAEEHSLRCFRTKALPPDVYPVYPPGVELFASEDATMISHGGLSLEELVVPFVEVARGS